MSYKVNPKLMHELEEYGLKDASKCFHCGNCTATCPLSDEDHVFPRRLVRMAQLGMEDKIKESPEPWLCYYCGDCSDRCPRGAEPGETMMVMRRYLTSLYDWTGFSRRFYTSEVFEVAAVAVVAAVVAILMLWGAAYGNLVTDRVAVNELWPAWKIEVGDLIMAAILTFFLLTNVWRCIKFVAGKWLNEIPLSFHLAHLKDLLIHFTTQKRFGECEDRMQWWIHLLIMTGYASVFLMVVVGIRVFQRDTVIVPEYPILSVVMTLVGYYATAALLYGSGYAMIGRIRKSKAPYKNSHATDWMFLILLFLTTLTGILMHAFIFLGWPMPTYVIYVIHLMIAIPMLVLEVPFAKWSHLAYRPVVLYLTKVKKAWEAAQ